MSEHESKIGVSYPTITITKSRIDKGLLAVPVSLLDKFPTQKQKITIYFDDEEVAVEKSFLPYNTSARESRIGGLSKWFAKNQIQDQDEIMIDFIDEKEGIYRLRKEKLFVNEIQEIEKSLLENLDTIEETDEIKENMRKYAKKTNLSEKEIYLNQYVRIKKLPIEKRTYKKTNVAQKKENVPFMMRKILQACYEGKCQLTDFTFIQRNGNPYFEIHHINENLGNHWENLLVVSPNIHAQFTYRDHTNFFDDHGWLIRVDFGDRIYEVNQQLNKLDRSFKKTIYE